MHRTEPASEPFPTRRCGIGSTFDLRCPCRCGRTRHAPGFPSSSRSNVRGSNLIGSSRPLPKLTTDVERLSLVIEIGGVSVRVNTTDARFLSLLQDRYDGFVTSSECADGRAEIEFDVDLIPSRFADPNAAVRVTQALGRWTFERGDFRAEWEPASRNRPDSPVRQSLLHRCRVAHRPHARAGPARRLSAAFGQRRPQWQSVLFAGVSGAGKTTISRLRPSDATLVDRRDFLRAQAG